MSYTRTYEMLEDWQKDLLNQIQNKTARKIWISAMEDVYTPIHKELVKVLNQKCSNLPEMSNQEIEDYIMAIYADPEDTSFLEKYPGMGPIQKIFEDAEYQWLWEGNYCDEYHEIFYEPNPLGVEKLICPKCRN
jgi:hypothetical protein